MGLVTAANGVFFVGYTVKYWGTWIVKCRCFCKTNANIDLFLHTYVLYPNYVL